MAQFIVFEGADGCGKSTQAAKLQEALAAQGVEAMLTREPGGTVIGEKLREILLDPAHELMTVETELMLYMAARSQFVTETVLPNLEKGVTVISERFLLSTLVYQGMAGGIDIEAIRSVAAIATRALEPTATIILDVETEEGLKRCGNNLDRMEAKGVEFHRQVREGYLSYAEEVSPSIVISAHQPIDEIHAEVLGFINTL